LKTSRESFVIKCSRGTRKKVRQAAITVDERETYVTRRVVAGGLRARDRLGKPEIRTEGAGATGVSVGRGFKTSGIARKPHLLRAPFETRMGKQEHRAIKVRNSYSLLSPNSKKTEGKGRVVCEHERSEMRIKNGHAKKTLRGSDEWKENSKKLRLH